jgi:signal transduction histidine kinase
MSPLLTRPQRRIALLLVGLCAALGVVEALQQHGVNVLREVRIPFRWTGGNALLPWLAALPFIPPVVWLAARLPLDRGRWRRNLGPHVAATVAFAAAHQSVAVLLLGAADLLVTHGPQPAYSAIFLKLFAYRFGLDVLVYWATVGLVHAERSAREAAEREQAAARLETSLSEARLAALRDQIDPHFLFNTLNSVSVLALRGDREGVTRVVAALGDLLRRSLDGGRAQEVPLAEELAMLEHYLEIQAIRFGERLTIERDIDPAAGQALVPSMITQPLVENAVQHAVAPTPGPARVAIRAHREGGSLRLEVSDSGPGFVGAAPREGIGLGNTRARLAQLYGAGHSLDLGPSLEGGARVVVRLPWRVTSG